MTIFQLASKFGIRKGDMDDILFEIKVNTAQLNHCDKPHDFSICIDRKTRLPVSNPQPIQMLGCKWECSKCGGRVQSTDKGWYEKGLKDANSTH